MDFYLATMFGRSGLSRAERESLAVVVSAANNCTYCVLHHSEALRKYEAKASIVEELGRGRVPTELTPRLQALAQYARKVTRQPFAVEPEDVGDLRQAGLSDEEILSANLVASYYNFVNRFVDGLGVVLEPGNQHQYYY